MDVEPPGITEFAGEILPCPRLDHIAIWSAPPPPSSLQSMNRDRNSYRNTRVSMEARPPQQTTTEHLVDDPSAPTRLPPLAQISDFWRRYDRLADIHDKKLTSNLNGNLDVLLIFVSFCRTLNEHWRLASDGSRRLCSPPSTLHLYRLQCRGFLPTHPMRLIHSFVFW